MGFNMYNRFANDLSEDLFNSVYADLYTMAEHENKSLYNSSKRKGKKVNVYRTGEAQENLNDFCKGRLSLGEALDLIRIKHIGV